MDEFGHGPVEATVHRYCCEPVLAITVEVPQIQFLRRWFLFFDMVVGDLRYVDRASCFQVAYGGRGRIPHISYVLLAPLALGLWTISTNLYLAGISRGVLASIHFAFTSNSHIAHVMFAPVQFALGNLDATFTSLRQWTQFMGWREGEFTSCSMEKAQLMLRLLGFALIAFGIWTLFSRAPFLLIVTWPLFQDCMKR